MGHISDLIPVGVLKYREALGILSKSTSGTKTKLVFIWSTNNLHFSSTSEEVVIRLPDGKLENAKHCNNFQFLHTIDGLVMTYIREEKGSKKRIIAITHDIYNLYEWKVKSVLEVESAGTALVESPGKHGNYLLYMSGLFARLGTSKDLKHWVKHQKLLFTSRAHNFDFDKITIVGSAVSKRGILVFYDASYAQKDIRMLQIGAVLFSKEQPDKIIWRSDDPLWTGLIHEKESCPMYPLGITLTETAVTFYWGSHNGSVISSVIALPFSVTVITPREQPILKRSLRNPILEPKSNHTWESEAVFNPAAVYDNGKIHLFYRAIGSNGVSVLGYASSSDGLNFHKRVAHPVYEPGKDYGLPKSKHPGPQTYDHLIYTSGGGWNGYEDPRAVKIDGRIYLTYLAFGGWDSMRLALTSISEKDLEEEHWNWSKPKYISPPGQVNKNWVLFPEKIHGKFAILHSISPKILIQYVDSLSKFDGKYFIKSQPPHGGRLEYWDTKVRGAGPPPLKTDLGWLVLYHANDMLEPHKYKLGAMILDKDDPTKILYRTSRPILSPDMPYENDGKPGIVYASGAVIKDEKLFVYYGGGDKVVCVAVASLKKFLDSIKKDKQFQFDPAAALTR